jgi:hypothetical protein
MTPLEYLRKQNEIKEEYNLKQKNNLLKIDNNFIESFISKNNIIAFKILFYISRIHNYDNNIMVKEETEINKYKVNTKELCKYCNIEKSQLVRTIKKLQETTITTINNDEQLEMITLIPRSSFIWGKNELEVDIYKKVSNMIIEVERKYTTIDFTNIMNIHNKHSFKILQLLEQINNYSRTGEKVYKHKNGKETTRIEIPKRKYFSLEEINLLLGTNYKSCSEIERRILKPTKEDLDLNSKITFIFDSIFDNKGKGRPKSKGFYFTVIDNKKRQLTLF